jgi:hypothetical protein
LAVSVIAFWMMGTISRRTSGSFSIPYSVARKSSEKPCPNIGTPLSSPGLVISPFLVEQRIR